MLEPVGGFTVGVGGWGLNAVWWLNVIVEFGADVTFNFIEASLLSTGGVSPLGIELDSGGGSNKGDKGSEFHCKFIINY